MFRAFQSRHRWIQRSSLSFGSGGGSTMFHRHSSCKRIGRDGAISGKPRTGIFSESLRELARTIGNVPRTDHHQLSSSQIGQGRRFLSSGSDEGEVSDSDTDKFLEKPREEDAITDFSWLKHLFLKREGEDSKILHRYNEKMLADLHYFAEQDQLGTGFFSLGSRTEATDYLRIWDIIESGHPQLRPSQVGDAIGLHYGKRVQLWLELIGKSAPSRVLTFSDYKDMDDGLRRYKMLFPKNIVRPLSVKGFFACTRDDFIYKMESGAVLHIRYQEEPYKELPWDYIPQAQALMALGGAPSLHLFFWSPEGCSLFLIRKDRALWQKISQVLDDFWELHVKPGRRSDMVDPSDQHQMLPYIYQRSINEALTKLLFYQITERSILDSADREDVHLVDMESYYKIEAPIVGRLKRRDLSTSDIVFLGITMYDQKKFLISLDDSLLGYILHCQTEGVRSIVTQELYMEAMYDALLRELVKHSNNPSTSSLRCSLNMEAAARIKSGDLCTHMFFTWAKTITVRWREDEWVHDYDVNFFMEFPYERNPTVCPYQLHPDSFDEQLINHKGWIHANDKRNRAFGTD